MGSDFTYEDISGREFDSYTYAMVEPDATWTGPGNQRAPAFRIESRARDFSRRELERK